MKMIKMMNKILKVLPFVVILLVSAAFAAAQSSDPAPTVGITAQPGTLVWNSVTIRVSASDSWPNAAISHIDFYVNGTFTSTHNCGFASSCIYTTSRLSGVQKNETYYAIVHDLSNSVQTQNLTVTFRGPNRPPNLSALPNISINEDSGNNVNLTDLHAVVTDDWTNSSNLVYTLAGQSNTTVANCTITGNQYIDCTTVTQDAFGTSVITVTASDGQLTGTGNFTLIVAPVNDAPVFNATIPAITFVEDTTYVFNISDYFYDLDDQPANIIYQHSNVLNMTIGYQFNLGTNKTEAVLIPAGNFTGVLTINFTAFDGQNYSAPSNNVVITITPVNDRPFFTSGTPPAGAWNTLPFNYQFNASDVDTIDTLTFYDNTTLFNIDFTSGWVNFTPTNLSNNTILITVCDDSGAVDNCTNITWNFNIYLHPPITFSNIYANPVSPATYSPPNATYTFSVTPVIHINMNNPIPQCSVKDKTWLEFNGTNYTAGRNTTTHQDFVNFTSLPAGNYTFRWHANYTNGLQYNSNWYNYTIDRASPGLMLNIPMGLTYGTIANVSCTINTTQVTPVLTRNGTVVSNPDSTLLGAGTYAYVCSVPQTQNYTAGNSTGTLTISPAQVTVNLNLQSPITYGTAANVTCNASPAAVTPTLTRNGAALAGLTDTSVLGAGTYNYACYYNATQNYTGDSKTQQLVVNKAQAIVNLTLNGTDGDISLPVNGSVINVTGTPITPAGGYVELYINGTLAASGNGAQSVMYNFSAGGTYPVQFVFNATQNYTGSSETHYVVVGSALAKININPVSGSNINGTSFTLSFNTNLNTSCRWSLTDQAYTAMTNDFATTGQTNHSGTITGINILGTQNVFISCINETATTNTDLTYNVQNIIAQGSTLINGASANNSILYSTSVDNSTLQSVNATGSTIRGSILTNCVVINSTVKNYQGSNCIIINSFVDPPNPGSDLTGSIITGNSRVMNSNVTYSTVTSSNITNSNVNNSQITNSEIISSNVDSCTSTGSQLSGGVVCTNSTVTGSILYNVTLINAIVNNGVLTSGTLIYNGTNYTAPPNQNIANITNLPPNGAFTYTRSNLRINLNAGSSSDPNPGDTLTYFWDFGDGTNTTIASATTSHTFVSAGTYNVTLTAIDNQGASDPTPDIQQITVTAGGGTTPPRRTGGGGGGGGSSAYARTWKIDLDERSPDIRTLSRLDKAVITLNNKTYTLRMDGIDRGHINFTLKDIPYSFINYEIKKMDFDSDGISDLRIIILNNYYTRAQLRFDKFAEAMGTTAPPFMFSNLSFGMEDNTTDVQDGTPDSIITRTITDEQNKTPTNATAGSTEGWLDRIPKDSQTIGIGITVGVVIAGLIVYFVISALVL